MFTRRVLCLHAKSRDHNYMSCDPTACLVITLLASRSHTSSCGRTTVLLITRRASCSHDMCRDQNTCNHTNSLTRLRAHMWLWEKVFAAPASDLRSLPPTYTCLHPSTPAPPCHPFQAVPARTHFVCLLVCNNHVTPRSTALSV